MQLSRFLNPTDVEDREYLVGLPPNEAKPTGAETWFGVWMRVKNYTDETLQPTEQFVITDTEGNEYFPVKLPDTNPFAYNPGPLPPHQVYPTPDSAAASGPIQGALILFKLKTESLQNRPLVLHIQQPGQDEAESTSTSRTPRRATVLRRRRGVSPPAPWPTSSTATAILGLVSGAKAANQASVSLVSFSGGCVGVGDLGRRLVLDRRAQLGGAGLARDLDVGQRGRAAGAVGDHGPHVALDRLRRGGADGAGLDGVVALEQRGGGPQAVGADRRRDERHLQRRGEHLALADRRRADREVVADLAGGGEGRARGARQARDPG